MEDSKGVIWRKDVMDEFGAYDEGESRDETLRRAGYRPRLLDARIEEALRRSAAVTLVGPAGCGKLTCALVHAASADLLDSGARVPDDARVRQGGAFGEDVRVDPSLVVQGASPHLVADVLAVPETLGGLKSMAQAMAESGVAGSLLVTADRDVWGALAKTGAVAEAAPGGAAAGSATTDAAAGAAPGGMAGRGVDAVRYLRMLTMSLQEDGSSDGLVSLAGLFEGELRASVAPVGMRAVPSDDASAGGAAAPAHLATTSRDVARMVCCGGWPAGAALGEREALEVADEQARWLVASAGERARLTAEGAWGCAWALARCLGEVATYEGLASGMEASSGRRPARDTVRRYLRELELSQLLLPVPGWVPPGRARIRMRTKPKQYFVDPSVPAMLLAKWPSDLAAEPRTLLALLGNLVARDLHIYVEAVGAVGAGTVPAGSAGTAPAGSAGTRQAGAGARPAGAGWRVCHYLDETGLAADFVVERHEGDGELSWGAVRVVLSEATADAAACDLRAIARKCVSTPPAFLAVVTGQGSVAYRRDDGVFVVPVACLGA